jgi:hypothetical protein
VTVDFIATGMATGGGAIGISTTASTAARGFPISTANEDRDLKPAANFRFIGKDVPRVEVPLKVTGAVKYAIDAQVPGMVYAAVLQSPYPGGKPETVDETRARQVAGITDVVKLPEGVGVVRHGKTLRDDRGFQRGRGP